VSGLRRYTSLFERLLANSAPVDPDNPNSCWLWTGHRHAKGYGQFSERRPGRRNPTSQLAHRAMLAIVEAPDLMDLSLDFWLHDPYYSTGNPPRELRPDDETVDHLCLVSACINPDHLQLLPRAENTARMQRLRRCAS